MAILAKSGTSSPPIVFKFAIGKSSLTAGEGELVHAEEQDHGDILMLPVKDFDREEGQTLGYNYTSSTTEKVLYSIQWAVENYNFRFFARIGDDSYFRPDEFYKQVCAGEYPSTTAVIGRLSSHSIQVGNGVGSNTNLFPYGMGYIFTHDVAAWIAKSAGMLSVGYPEDAVVGSWLAGTRVQYVDVSDKFHDANSESRAYKPCNEQDLLMHHVEKKADWDLIDLGGVMAC